MVWLDVFHQQFILLKIFFLFGRGSRLSRYYTQHSRAFYYAKWQLNSNRMYL